MINKYPEFCDKLKYYINNLINIYNIDYNIEYHNNNKVKDLNIPEKRKKFAIIKNDKANMMMNEDSTGSKNDSIINNNILRIDFKEMTLEVETDSNNTYKYYTQKKTL